MKILTNLDLSQNEIQNAIMQPLAAPPSNPKLGQIYFNSIDLTLYLWTGEKWIPVPTKLSQLENDSKFITAKDVPEGAVASTTTPKMNGTAAVGSETAFARGDHVHPKDTSKLNTDGDGSNVTVAFEAAAMRHYFFSRKAADEAARKAAGLPPRPMNKWYYADGWVLKGDFSKFFYTLLHSYCYETARRALKWLKDP